MYNCIFCVYTQTYVTESGRVGEADTHIVDTN